MIIVTGDTHRDFSRLGNKNLNGALTEDDYIIIAGDCGLTWSFDREFEYWKKWLSGKPFKTLFVDGNHENFDLLNNYRVDNWHGGKVHHIVEDKIIHLMRGQVYEIENKTIFTFGGGKSVDIQGGLLDPSDPDYRKKVKEANREGLPYRVIGKSWWPQEMPSEIEKEEGLKNLEKVNYTVDYIITHAICSSILPELSIYNRFKMLPDELTDYLQIIADNVSFDKWFCGHYHMDVSINERYTVLYKQLKQVF